MMFDDHLVFSSKSKLDHRTENNIVNFEKIHNIIFKKNLTL